MMTTFRCWIASLAIAVSPAIADPPAPRQRLQGNAYTEPYDDLAARQKPDDSEPADGVLVMAVDDGSPAAGLGVKFGDIVCGIDGQPIHTQRDYDRARAGARRDLTFELWSPITLARRNVVVHPGRLGVTLDDNLSLDVAYVRGVPKGIDPSVELLVAARAAPAEPELAETALFHAAERGCKGGPFAALCAVTAYHDARYADAIAWASEWDTLARADDDATSPWRRIVHRAAYRSALATGRFADALRIRTNDPDALAKADSNLPVGTDFLRPAASGTAAPGGDVDFGSLAGLTDHAKDLANADNGTNERRRAGSEFAVGEIRHGRPIRFNENPEQFYRYTFGPPGGNAELSVRCDCHATKLDDVAQAYVSFALTTEPGTDHGQLIAVHVYPGNGKVYVLPANLPPCISDHQARINDRQPFDVVVTLIADRCRVTVGGHAAFDGILPGSAAAGSRQVCATALTTGLTGTLSHVQWRTTPAK